MNSFTIIFERFCKHWKYLSLSYQNFGAAIAMEYLSNCFCILGGRPSLNPIWLASWVCFYLIAYCNTIATPSDVTEGKKKSRRIEHRKNLSEWITFFIIPPPLNVTFCQLFFGPTSPLANWCTFWMTPTWH